MRADNTLIMDKSPPVRQLTTALTNWRFYFWKINFCVFSGRGGHFGEAGWFEKSPDAVPMQLSRCPRILTIWLQLKKTTELF